MPFGEATRADVHQYATGDLDGGLERHVENFAFLDCDPELRQRVGEEYFSARYLYKLFEGLRVQEGWARRAQVQLQVQQYASIYEACLHHLLFQHCRRTPEVRSLLASVTYGSWDVPRELTARMDAALMKAACDAGDEVVVRVKRPAVTDSSKVRFDRKVATAVGLGMVSRQLGDELVAFYTTRNMIHIHAELRKGKDWQWEVEFARDAYRRLQPFTEQLNAWRHRVPTACALQLDEEAESSV